MKSNGNGKANGKVKSGPDGRVRCAIYTRKSTSEGLDSDFNTLDAQREACEFFIRSQVGDGWEVIETHYDDGGYTGGNIDRPAFQRLLTDIENGLVDQIVVYKVDRLSRSLMDFARIMGNLDAANIGFVSVTQQFNTASSMGRLTLNILLSFAQFEREIISERTRDKIGASRKRGKWTGGFVPLGYAVDRERKRLVIVPEEADVVRRVFGLYLSIGSPAIDRADSWAGPLVDITGSVRVDDPGTVNGGSDDYIENDLGTNAFAAVGTAQNWRSDDTYWTLAFPFAFPFYDSNYTSVYVSSNGFLQFGTASYAGDGSNSFTEFLDSIRMNFRTVSGIMFPAITGILFGHLDHVLIPGYFC